jgi:outer membrane protein TolC
VVQDDVVVTERYAGQLEAAVKVGTAFRADLLRVRTQLSRLRLQVRQLEEGVELSAARLSETLRLPSDTALRGAKADMVPVVVVREERLAALISQARAERPEVASLVALSEAARTEEERARRAPWVPSVQAGYSAGGFGGGMDGRLGRFGGQQDFFVGFSWKVGAGGLFDSVRKEGAAVRKESLTLSGKRLEAAIGREVVEAHARSRSAREQIKIAEESVVAAEEMTRLAGERQASQVGVVLEYITAREELTRARLAQVRAVMDHNRAQQALKVAVGAR